MAHQERPAQLAVGPAGPAAAPARVLALTRRRLHLSVLRLRRALRAEVGVLWSMLSKSPLGSRRLFGVISAELQEITASNQPLVESRFHQRRPSFHSCFHILVLLSLVLFILYFNLSSSTLWESFPLNERFQRFFNRTNKVHLPPPYRVHQKLGVTPTEIFETTESPPTGIQYHQAYPHNYHFFMDNKEVCKIKKPFLVLMVPVRPQNVEARNAIRQTWGNDSVVQGEVVLTLFMLGSSDGSDVEKLKQENLEHHDLIQSNFIDTYLNLTIKTMVIMDWLVTRCPTATYAMKVDSDMFLNIDNLLIMLHKPDIPKTNYLTGMLMLNRPVVRSKNSKWYVSEELYPQPLYPTYTLGMGYVFSNDLPGKFLEVSKSIKAFNIEDAYIGMCMEKLGLAPTSPPDPSQFRAYNMNYDRCEFSKSITYILGSSQNLIDYWTDLKKPGPPC